MEQQKYIVCYVYGETFAQAVDKYDVFFERGSDENHQEALDRYHQLQNDEFCHSVSLCEIKESTDY
jgi:hypothetical protein